MRAATNRENFTGASRGRSNLPVSLSMVAERRIEALVALTAIASHASSLGAGFVWLDHAHIEEGLALARPGAWAALFAHGFAGTGFYRPLMSASLSLDAAFGGAPWLYHATSSAWHAAAAVMTVVAAGALGIPRRAAATAGVLFAVHPVTSLVSNAIAFRSEAMIATMLLALVALHRRGHRWGAGAALLAAGLTKETGVVLGPLFVLALEWASPNEDRRESGARVRLWATEAGAWAAVLALRYAFAPSWRAGFAPLAFSDAVGTRLASLAKSAARLVVPIEATICDSFPVSPLFGLRALSGAVVLAGLAYLALRRRGPALLLFLSILPSLQLVPVMRWWSPHYLYVPLAFAAMLVAQALDLRSKGAVRWAVLGASLLAAMSFVEGLRYRSDESLWAPEVAADPTCREAHFYLAESAREARQWDEAASRYEHALASSPATLSYVDQLSTLQNLGVVRLEQHKPSEALVAFRAALGVAGDDEQRRRLTHNLATAELSTGNAQEAARLLAPEVVRTDALPASMLVRARALATLGEREQAAALIERLKATRGAPQE
ncbi:MAG TPA: hypothetical protein VJT73_09260 [Polyangiaceae bacterium]|nr:hypothetical protein [Polyangiaceae bacterium]